MYRNATGEPLRTGEDHQNTIKTEKDKEEVKKSPAGFNSTD